MLVARPPPEGRQDPAGTIAGVRFDIGRAACANPAPTRGGAGRRRRGRSGRSGWRVAPAVDRHRRIIGGIFGWWRRYCGAVASSDDKPSSDLAGAVGNAALFPARAAARAWRGPIEHAVDEILSTPEIARVVDRALAGSLPEEMARSVARHHVLERITAELVETGELQRLVTAALASQQARDLTDQVLASDHMHRVVSHVASSPELREAIARQTTGFAEEMIGGIRSSAQRLDDRAERLAHGPARAGPVEFGGIATRALALLTDTGLAVLLYMAAVGIVSLVASLVGGLRPQWLVGVLLACGWVLVVGTYFVASWSSVGQTPGMRLMRVRVDGPAGAPISVGRSLVRVLGLVLSIIPLFAGFLPVLFTKRRRGLADFLAGTVVRYEGPRATDTGTSL